MTQPLSSDSGVSVRNYNHFVGWYRRNTFGSLTTGLHFI